MVRGALSSFQTTFHVPISEKPASGAVVAAFAESPINNLGLMNLNQTRYRRVAKAKILLYFRLRLSPLAHRSFNRVVDARSRGRIRGLSHG